MAVETTSGSSPLLLVPYLLVFLAAASVKSFLRSYSSLHSLARLLTAATTKADSGTYASSKDRQPNGCSYEHGLQELSAAGGAEDEQQTLLTGEDVEEILRRIGLVGAEERMDGEGIYRVGHEGGEVSRVFDADEPSLEEVRRAFAIFDEDGDGFICPADLRSALERMGFLQADVGACRQMIDVASCGGSGAGRDGGRMSLSQFVRFLESGF